MKLLVIDNYDSFTYNLVQLFGEMDADLTVKRNDEISIDEIKKLKPDRICISPGPGRPENAGISSEVIRELGPRVPILGVCLGHQCIAQAFGGEVVRAERLMHGKTSKIHHKDRGVFKDLAAHILHKLTLRTSKRRPRLPVCTHKVTFPSEASTGEDLFSQVVLDFRSIA